MDEKQNLQFVWTLKICGSIQICYTLFDHFCLIFHLAWSLKRMFKSQFLRRVVFLSKMRCSNNNNYYIATLLGILFLKLQNSVTKYNCYIHGFVVDRCNCLTVMVYKKDKIFTCITSCLNYRTKIRSQNEKLPDS